MESEAIALVLKLFEVGQHTWVSSEVVEDEVGMNPDGEKRLRILELLESANAMAEVSPNVADLARELSKEGFGATDALHVATAQVAGCDLLLTTDDDLLRKARRSKHRLTIRVENPVRWITEILIS